MATEKIYSIKNVSLKILKKNPAALLIEVEGSTSTTGYTHPKLEPRIYVMPPLDGIWEFDFYADVPTGIVGQMITPISTHYEWDKYPAKEVKGIKVYSQTNDKTEKI